VNLLFDWRFHLLIVTIVTLLVVVVALITLVLTHDVGLLYEVADHLTELETVKVSVGSLLESEGIGLEMG